MTADGFLSEYRQEQLRIHHALGIAMRSFPMRAFGQLPRRLVYPLVGSLLAMGAPGGLLVLRGVLGRATSVPSWVFGELVAQPPLYTYVASWSAVQLGAAPLITGMSRA